jgi:FKBP-type peptidyl-prolyl cis-trans isomerase
MLRISQSVFTLLCVASLGLFSSCNRVLTNEKGTTSEGNEYQIFRSDDNSHKIADEDILDLHFVVKNAKDSIVQSTYQGKEPIKGFSYPEKEVDKAFLKMLKMLTVGDSAVFRIKTEVELKESLAQLDKTKEQIKSNFEQLPDSIQKKNAESLKTQLQQVEDEKGKLDKYFPKGKFITYHIKILKVTEVKPLKQKEKAQLEEYAKKNKLSNVQVTASNLHYVVTKEGKGAKPQKGEFVKVNYVGKLENGKVFDTSIESVAKEAKLNRPGKFEPLGLAIGMGQVIKGWDEGIMLLNEGAKATFLIPARLAYGANSPSPDIPKDANLIFDVELVEIVQPNKPKGKEEK